MDDNMLGNAMVRLAGAISASKSGAKSPSRTAWALIAATLALVIAVVAAHLYLTAFASE